MEFCSLSVEDKLEVLVALVDRILNSYSVADHMEKKIVESKAAWRHRIKVVLGSGGFYGVLSLLLRRVGYLLIIWFDYYFAIAQLAFCFRFYTQFKASMQVAAWKGIKVRLNTILTNLIYVYKE